MRINDCELLLDICPYVYHFIKSNNLKQMPNGQYKLENGIVLNIDTYKTEYRKNRKYELHKRYIDVQYIIEGKEIISICPVEKLNKLGEYDVKKDICFYKTNYIGTDYLLNNDDFLIIEDQKPHMPCIAYKSIISVKKAVFKVPIVGEKIDKNKIKYLILDVDGTLTDGKIVLLNSGDESKNFNIKDGYAIKKLVDEEIIEPIVITGRSSKIVEKRCLELGITKVFQGVTNKYKVLETIVDDLSKVAYMGDDDNDIKCMKIIKDSGGIIACPKNSSHSVLSISSFISRFNGGDGAVREFIEWLLDD